MMEKWFEDYVADAKSMEEVKHPLYEHMNAVMPMDKYGPVNLCQVIQLPVAAVRQPLYKPYVAVVGRWTEDMWLCIPFSHLAYPATTGEMGTVYGAPLAVMQPWLGKLIPTSLLMKGYYVGDITVTERIDAYDLFRHCVTNTPLMSTFKCRRGSKITDPLDFRVTYQNEERYQWEPLQKVVLQELGEDLDVLPAE